MRAVMMLLGLVLHSMASYTTAPMGDAWPFRDAHTSPVMTGLIAFIHLFRMPAFFAVAGFFAALLYQRDGLTGFVRNRVRRVALPLVLFWITVGPLVMAAFYFAITRAGLLTGDALLAQTRDTFRITDLSPMHLWFLWYLVVFYAAAVAVMTIAGQRRIDPDLAARLTTSWWSLPLWVAVSAVTLLPMPYAAIMPSPVIFADPRTLAAYGVFFVFGWLLFRGRDELDRIARWWSWGLLLTTVCLVIAWNFALAFSTVRALDFVIHRLIVAYLTWTLVLASFGLFVYHAHRERPALRFLADASYWSYIIHLPIVVATAGLLAPAPLSAWPKFAIVLSVTTAICVVTYRAFVRGTWIGELLNGRRYGRRTAPYLGAM